LCELNTAFFAHKLYLSVVLVQLPIGFDASNPPVEVRFECGVLIVTELGKSQTIFRLKILLSVQR
jgi:hypothetical protein